MERCKVCRSVHAPDQYQVGYFLLDSGEIKEVQGEAEVVLATRKTLPESDQTNPDFICSQVFWTREGAEDAKLRMSPVVTDYYTGEVLADKVVGEREPTPAERKDV